MFLTCEHCNTEDPFQYLTLEEVIPSNTPVTVCHYEENGTYFNATLRLPLKTKEEVLLWLEEFEALSKTTLRKSKTFPHIGGKLLYKCIYRCQHNTNQKNEATNSKQSSKNTNCPFQLTANLRRTDVKQRRAAKDIHFHIPTCIVIRFHHNHDLDSVEVLKKRDVGSDVRAKFVKLFEAGHSPSSALETHKYDLMEEGPENYALKVHDRRYCPDIQWCFRFYYKMFTTEYGPASAVETALALQQRVDQFNGEFGEKTVAFNAVGDYIAIAVCTPLMKRVHRTLISCADCVFIDSSACTDQSNECYIFMLSTSCPEIAGGLPLGIIITTSKSEQAVTNALELLKSLLPTGAFHSQDSSDLKLGPRTFLTCNATALRDSLTKTFLQSAVMTSQYHVLVDAWSWLWSSKSCIAMTDRGYLYTLIEQTVEATSCHELAAAFTAIHTDQIAVSYPQLLDYVNDLLDKSTQWATCYNISCTSLSNDKIELLSVKMAALMQRDKIFNRLKSFSPIQLVDFTVSRLERYFERRLRNVCRAGQWFTDDCRRAGRTLMTHRFPRDGQIVLENIWMISQDVVLVPTDGALLTALPSCTHPSPSCYFVNTVFGVCTCPAGINGTPCKHHSAAILKYPPVLSAFPTGLEGTGDFQPTSLSTAVRNQLLYIATGIENNSSSTLSEESWLVDVSNVKSEQQTVMLYVGEPATDSLSTLMTDTVVPNEETPSPDINTPAVGDDVSRTVERFIAFSSEMTERISLDPNTYLEPVKSFLASYEKINTSAGLVSALRCFGEYSRVASAVIAGRKRRALRHSNNSSILDKKYCM